MCSVVYQLLVSVELRFQLCNSKGGLDAVADGLQPSQFSSLHQLLIDTLLSQLGTGFSLLEVFYAFLHGTLGSEFFVCLAEIPALLVLLVSTMASVPLVCGLCGK